MLDDYYWVIENNFFLKPWRKKLDASLDTELLSKIYSGVEISPGID